MGDRVTALCGRVSAALARGGDPGRAAQAQEALSQVARELAAAGTLAEAVREMPGTNAAVQEALGAYDRTVKEERRG